VRVLTFILAVITAAVLYAGPGDDLLQRPKVSAEMLVTWLDSSDPPLVLDVRGRTAYRSGTLPSAIDGGTDPMGFLPGGSQDIVVLLLAEGADAALIDAWFNRLVDAGHKVRILEKGLDGWIEAGGEVVEPTVTYTKPGTVPFVIPKGLCEGSEPAQVFE